MKKSIFRWGFVLSMLLGLLITGVMAVEAPTMSYTDICKADHVGAKGTITGTQTLSSSGLYYLTGDITAEALQIKANAAHTICLNGHNITVTAQTYDYFMHLTNARKVSICNCKDTGGVITIVGADSDLFQIRATATLGLYGNVTFKNCNVKNFIQYNSATAPTVNLCGVKFEDNTFAAGFNCGTGTMNMYDDTVISGNTSSSGFGGGVWVNGGTFNMMGGTITGNKATRGSGVAVTNGGTFNMTDGKITGNIGASTAYRGAGVYVGANTATNGVGTATITGGEISGQKLAAGTEIFDVTVASGDCTIGGTVLLPKGTYFDTTQTKTLTFEGGICKTIGGSATGATITIKGGTLGYSASAEMLLNNLATDVPVSFEAVTVEGWEHATKVTPGFERQGESYEFKSDLNFGLTMNCNNNFVANNPEYEYVCAISSAAGTYELTKVSEDTMLKLMATGITAKEIGTPITFTIKSTDGETVFFNETLSVADIAAAQWATTEDAAMKTLYEDMINYGNAAATAFGGTTVDALGEGSVAPTWVHSEGYGASADGIAIATLSLKDKIQLNIYIDGEAVVEGGVYNADTNITTVTYDDIAIADAMEPITLTFTVGEQAYTVVYSIADYVVDALNGEQAALIGALQKYIASVCAVCAKA